MQINVTKLGAVLAAPFRRRAPLAAQPRGLFALLARIAIVSVSAAAAVLYRGAVVT